MNDKRRELNKLNKKVKEAPDTLKTTESEKPRWWDNPSIWDEMEENF